MNNASEVVPPQVYIRCTYCSQSLGHSLLVQSVRTREGKRMNVQANVTPAPATGGRVSNKQNKVKQNKVLWDGCARETLGDGVLLSIHLTRQRI